MSKAAAELPSPFGRLDALLHTVRCIAQYEDALCELSHEVRQSGRLSRQTRGVLDALLKKIPSQDYVHDLDAVTDLLADAPQPASATPGIARKSPSIVPKKKRASMPARKPASAKRISGRKSSS